MVNFDPARIICDDLSLLHSDSQHVYHKADVFIKQYFVVILTFNVNRTVKVNGCIV